MSVGRCVRRVTVLQAVVSEKGDQKGSTTSRPPRRGYRGSLSGYRVDTEGIRVGQEGRMQGVLIAKGGNRNGRREVLARVAPLVLAAGVPVVAFEALVRLAPHLDPLMPAPRGHFYLVSATALAAGALAVAVGANALRHRNTQAVFLALAFTSLVAFVSLHGLATPGFLLPVTPLHGIAEQVGLTLAAAWLGLSLVPTSAPFCRRLVPHLAVVAWGWTLGVALAVVVSLANPHQFHAFTGGPSVHPAVGVTTALMFLAAALQYWRWQTVSRSPLQRATAFAAAWFAGVQWMMLHGTVWRASWWMHHVLQAAAVVAVVAAAAREHTQQGIVGGWLRPLPADPEALLRAASTETVRALVAATELRDPYTAGHSYWVTRQALEVGRALGLPPHSLEALVRGTLVHDVAKLEIPDAVLNKPGPLTPEERHVVERHPVAGEAVCARLGFLPEELAIVRHHHERWDGAGYPDGLAGEQIPLLARIVAVVDVYDALTSQRAYRDAWETARAQAYIREHAGTQFDPRVVAVWSRLMESTSAASPSAPIPHTGGWNRPSTAVQPPSTTSTEPVT